LAACSYDGTIRILSFTSSELGNPVSEDEIQRLLSKFGYKKTKMDTLESVDMLLLENEGRMKAAMMGSENGKRTGVDITHGIESMTPPLHVNGNNNNNSTSNAITGQSSVVINEPKMNGNIPSIESTKVIQSQKVTIGKDGKKRVSPMFLGRYGEKDFFFLLEKINFLLFL